VAAEVDAARARTPVPDRDEPELDRVVPARDRDPLALERVPLALDRDVPPLDRAVDFLVVDLRAGGIASPSLDYRAVLE
jgi:hypothetical protein